MVSQAQHQGQSDQMTIYQPGIWNCSTTPAQYPLQSTIFNYNQLHSFHTPCIPCTVTSTTETPPIPRTNACSGTLPSQNCPLVLDHLQYGAVNDPTNSKQSGAMINHETYVCCSGTPPWDMSHSTDRARARERTTWPTQPPDPAFHQALQGILRL